MILSIDPTVDYAFKRIFGRDVNLLSLIVHRLNFGRTSRTGEFRIKPNLLGNFAECSTKRKQDRPNPELQQTGHAIDGCRASEVVHANDR
jgi:hypothetical protein